MNKTNWLSAIEFKPGINVSDAWDRRHRISERVVIWLEGHKQASFGTYNFEIKRWSIEGYSGFDQDRVKYFTEITNPYL